MAKVAANKRKPWKRPPPRNVRHIQLTPGSKAAAKKRAKRAGRAYPNLVDNMRAARAQRSRKAK